MLTTPVQTPERVRLAIYNQALLESSIERQVMHLAEENGELMIEISHLIRGRTQDPKAVVLEIADVMVMLDVFRHLLGIRHEDIQVAIDAKLEKFRTQLKSPPVI